MPNANWLKYFHITKNTFQYIVSYVKKNRVKHEINDADDAPPLQVQIAMTIFYLATGCDHTFIMSLFGVDWSNVIHCIDIHVEFFTRRLDKFIELPDFDEILKISQRIEDHVGIPQVWGFIDGKKIPVIPDDLGYSDGICTAITLQSIVDDNHMFRGLSVDMYDHVQIFTKSLLSEAMQESDALLDENLCLLGSSSYPQLKWLMAPYSGNDLTPQQENFNVQLNFARRYSEQTFDRLKARWNMCSNPGNSASNIDMEYIVKACCVLHNICERMKSPVFESWTEDLLNFHPIEKQKNPMHSLSDDRHQSFDDVAKCLFENFPIEPRMVH